MCLPNPPVAPATATTLLSSIVERVDWRARKREQRRDDDPSTASSWARGQSSHPRRHRKRRAVRLYGSPVLATSACSSVVRASTSRAKGQTRKERKRARDLDASESGPTGAIQRRGHSSRAWARSTSSPTTRGYETRRAPSLRPSCSSTAQRRRTPSLRPPILARRTDAVSVSVSPSLTRTRKQSSTFSSSVRPSSLLSPRTSQPNASGSQQRPTFRSRTRPSGPGSTRCGSCCPATTARRCSRPSARRSRR